MPPSTPKRHRLFSNEFVPSIAQIYLNDDSSHPAQQTTFLRSSMNDANKNYDVRISHGDSITSLVDQIGRGALALLSTLHPSSINSAEMTNTTTHQSQRIQDDYSFIFYLLLGINVLTMIPAWCKCFSSTKKNQTQSIHTTKVTQQQEQRMTEDTQSLIHGKLLQTYLPAYLFATCADWLQGPYKYALYSSYGYTQRDIAHLFVAGYGSG